MHEGGIFMSLRYNLGLLTTPAYALVAMRGLMFLGVQISYFVGVMGTLAYSMNADTFIMACVVGVLNLMQVIGDFFGGSFLDAHGPRIHARTAIVFMTSTAVCFVLFGTTNKAILACSALFGMSVGFADAISRAYPAYLTQNPTELKTINSVLSVVSNIAGVLGPILGGCIASVFPSRMVFVVTIATSLTTGIFINAYIAGTVDSNQNRVRDDNTKPSIKEGFVYVLKTPTLAFLFCMGFVSFLGFGAFDPLESLYYRDVLHVGVAWMGWLSSGFGIGCAIGSLLVLHIPAHHVNSKTLLWCIVLMGLCCALYVGTDNVYICMTGQILEGVAEGLTFPLLTTLTQTHTDIKRLGIVNGVMNFGLTMAGVVPLFCAPAISDILGVQGTLISASFVVALVPILCRIFWGKHLNELVKEEQSFHLVITE